MIDNEIDGSGFRLKEIRKALRLTQIDFANIINTSNGHVSDMEKDRKNITDTTIDLLKLKCNVNENWLRTGEGGEENMFIKPSPTNLAYNHFGYLMGNASPQKKAVLSALIEMVYQYPDDKWDYVFNQFENCLEEAKKAKKNSEES